MKGHLEYLFWWVLALAAIRLTLHGVAEVWDRARRRRRAKEGLRSRTVLRPRFEGE